MQQFSKINQELISILKEINKFLGADHLEDFDYRGGYITANIKVYKWLDSDDVEKIIQKHNLKKRGKILREFDEDRLFGIIDHVNQWEIECFKESFTWKEKTGDTGWDNALDIICADPDNVWQFGRSGGHLSFCKASELEFEYNENDATLDASNFIEQFDENWSNYELNEFLKNELSTDYKNKHNHIKYYKQELSEMQAKVDARTYIKDEIERMAKGIDYSERLEHEILEFVNENQKTQNCSISIDGDNVKTSLGITVPLEPVKAFVSSLSLPLDKKKVTIGAKVEKWTIENARKKKNDWIIKAGCHRFSLNQCLSAMESQLTNI